ncbi:MAG: serine protease Do [Candidatus Krumholzibacteriia bacterium]|jgi:serine protease Do
MTLLNAAKRQLLIAMTLVIALSFSAYAHDGEHGYLGVMLQSINASMAKALQLDEDQGVLINKVIEDGPAEKAGLEDGDVILSFNGEEISKHSDLTKAVRSTSAGDEASVEVLHNGARKTLKVAMGENDDDSFSYSFSSDGHDIRQFVEGDSHAVIIDGDEAVRWVGKGGGNRWFNSDNDFVIDINGDRGFMGVELEDLSEQLGEFFGATDGDGALVSKVVEDSPAEKSGLKAGDVIVGLGDDSVTSASDVHNLMSGTEADDEVTVEVLRDGKKRSITMTLAEAPETSWSQLHTMRAPRAPRGLRHEMRFPHQNMRAKSPRHATRIMDIHADDDLSELKSELNELKEELKELQKELDD